MPVNTKQRKWTKKATNKNYRRSGPPASLYAPRKTHATALKCTDMLTTGAVQAATAPAVLVVPVVGPGYWNRLGNRTRGVSLQLTGFVSPTQTNAAALTMQYMRILIYFDRQSNGANPTQATLLSDTVAAGTQPAVNPESGLNIANRDRFMVLRDRKILLPDMGINGAAFGTGQLTQCLNDLGKGGLAYQEFIKLKGLESCYNTGTAGTVADISAGSFGILVFNADASGSPAWNFTLQARFKFLD